nr:hypothetical protein CcurKRNrm1_p103 [Cryptomonas curvata]
MIIDKIIKRLCLSSFLNKTSITLKSYNGEKNNLYQKKERFYLKNVKKNLNYVNKKLKKWFVFSYVKKNKMLKTKKYMLTLQKNIINRHDKN